jgi:hypothetical protein
MSETSTVVLPDTPSVDMSSRRLPEVQNEGRETTSPGILPGVPEKPSALDELALPLINVTMVALGAFLLKNGHTNWGGGALLTSLSGQVYERFMENDDTACVMTGAPTFNAIEADDRNRVGILLCLP